jgi:hypothetical protein
MKKIILATLVIVVSHAITIGQTLKYKAIQNADLNYVLNNIEKTTQFAADNGDLFIKAYIVADPSGSAHVDGTDEITNSIYIAVSEDGEAPEQHLFRLTSVYDPKFVNWIKTPGGPELVISYGPANKRKKATVHVALKQLVIR